MIQADGKASSIEIHPETSPVTSVEQRNPPQESLSLSIFFPCFNDEGTVGSLVAAGDIVASEYTKDYEIIVVDDGSSDSSKQLLQTLQEKYPKLRLVFHGENRGYGAALRSGFSNATRDLVFYTDGDGQYDVFELRHFLPIMRSGIDVVNGYKITRNDPFHRKIIGIIYLRLMRLLFNFHSRDVDCDFRLIRRRAFDHIKLTHNSGVICLELVKKLELAGYRFAEYPVHHFHRTYGKSQFFNFGRLVRTGIGILVLWWNIVVLGRASRDVARLLGDDEKQVNHSLAGDESNTVAHGPGSHPGT
jgi:glycosyltransferase involved in cell wall biosynthesis